MSALQVNFIGIQGYLDIAAHLFDLAVPDNDSTVFDKISRFGMDHSVGQGPDTGLVDMNIFYRLDLGWKELQKK
jgi:hypothetical protein